MIKIKQNICKDCIHKDVCKDKEDMGILINAMRVFFDNAKPKEIDASYNVMCNRYLYEHFCDCD